MPGETIQKQPDQEAESTRFEDLISGLGATARKLAVDDERLHKESFSQKHQPLQRDINENQVHKQEARQRHEDNWATTKQYVQSDALTNFMMADGFKAGKNFGGQRTQVIEVPAETPNKTLRDIQAREDFNAYGPFPEDAHEKSSGTAESLDTLEERSEKMFNKYKSNFGNKSASWLEHGVVKSLEDGKFETRPDVLLRTGFVSEESDNIEQTLDPEGLSSGDAIYAGGELKRRVMSEVIDPGVENLRKERNGVKNGETYNIRKSELNVSLRRGIMRAISTGAYIDNQTGKVVYSLPTEKGQELHDYIEKEADINLGEYKQGDSVRLAAYQGIANIIEAIKDKPGETEKGFKAIDWYFDHFKCKEHVADFMDQMDAFDDPADNAWTAKYEEYRKHRQEIADYLQQKKNKIPTIQSISPIQSDDLNHFANSLNSINALQIYGQILELFPDKEKFPTRNPGIGSYNSPRQTIPGAQKTAKALAEFQNILAVDPSAQPYSCVMEESSGKLVPYLVFEYSQNVSYVAIAIPIAVASNDAAYVRVRHRNIPGAKRTDWVDVFSKNPNPQVPTSKWRARQHEDVRVFNHISAMKTRGLNATDNMWFNIHDHINKTA